MHGTTAARANLVLRLKQIAARIDELANELRRPGHDPEVSSALWQLCAAHQRILVALSQDVQTRRAAEGTVQIRPLPRGTDPIWQVERRARGVVEVLHDFLDDGVTETSPIRRKSA